MKTTRGLAWFPSAKEHELPCKNQGCMQRAPGVDTVHIAILMNTDVASLEFGRTSCHFQGRVGLPLGAAV